MNEKVWSLRDVDRIWKYEYKIGKIIIGRALG